MSNDDQYVTPVKHTSMSAFGTTAAGTAGGAIKGGLGAAGAWVLGATIIGGLAAAALFTVLFGGPASLAFLAPVVHAVFSPLGLTVAAGAVGGAVLGLGSSWLPGGLGAIFGGFSGGAKAAGRVSQENAAAQQAEAQIAAAQMQYAAAAPAAQVNVGYPAQGSRFNEAGSSIQADSAAYAGKMNNVSREAALA